jgi:hippurate hydrolase
VTEVAELADLYKDLHAHPELAFAEHRTAALVAARLRDLGYQVTEGVGGTGVVGVMKHGDGPVALLRADMDALAVREQTGLPYASTVSGHDRETPVMHACGHDMHVACLLGAAAELAADPGSWRGTLLLVFQPAEETGEGARAMIDDGLFDRFAAPGVVLGRRRAVLRPSCSRIRSVLPSPARTRSASPAFARAITGRARDRVDPVLMAAPDVQRLHGISPGRCRPPTPPSSRSARACGHCPMSYRTRPVLLSVRSFDPAVRDNCSRRSAHHRSQAAASGAPRQIISLGRSRRRERRRRVRRVPDAAAGIGPGWCSARVGDQGEDVGLLSTAAGAPPLTGCSAARRPLPGITSQPGRPGRCRHSAVQPLALFAPLIEHPAPG